MGRTLSGGVWLTWITYSRGDRGLIKTPFTHWYILASSDKSGHKYSSGKSRIHYWCPTLATPWTVYSLPGSFVHGVLQVRILEWVAISFEILHRKWIKRQSFTQLKDIAHHVERTNEQEIKKNFIFGCAESSLLCVGPSRRRAWVLGCAGLSGWGSQA